MNHIEPTLNGSNSTPLKMKQVQTASPYPQIWIELCELRNRLVHEYMESADDLLSHRQQALHGFHVLTATQLRVADYVQNRVGYDVSFYYLSDLQFINLRKPSKRLWCVP